jgi:Leucine-rich repeat (LRR) protein
MNRYALIVAVDYRKENDTNLAKLDCAVRHAIELEKLFEDSRIGQFPKDHVRVLDCPSKVEFHNGLDWLYSKPRLKSDITVFYYIGHGVLHGEKLMLCTSEEPYYNNRVDEDNLVDIKEKLRDYLIIRSSGNEHTGSSGNEDAGSYRAGANLIFLDCCYSGNLEIVSNKREANIADFYVLASTEKGQKAISNFCLEDHHEEGMLFSTLLVQVLQRGLVESSDQEGQILISELYAHLLKEIYHRSEKKQKVLAKYQNPILKTLKIFRNVSFAGTHKKNIETFETYLKDDFLLTCPYSYAEAFRQKEVILYDYADGLNLPDNLIKEVISNQCDKRKKYEKLYYSSKKKGKNQIDLEEDWNKDVQANVALHSKSSYPLIIGKNIDEIYNNYSKYCEELVVFSRKYRKFFFEQCNFNVKPSVEKHGRFSEKEVVKSWYEEGNAYIIYSDIEETIDRTIVLFKYAQRVVRENLTLDKFRSEFLFKDDEKEWLEIFLREKKKLFLEPEEVKPVLDDDKPKEDNSSNFWNKYLNKRSLWAVGGIILFIFLMFFWIYPKTNPQESKLKGNNSNQIGANETNWCDPPKEIDKKDLNNLLNEASIGGVNCQDIPSIRSISLHNKGITTKILNSYLLILQHLPNLEDLDLSYNQINDVSKFSQVSLKNLKRLNLSNNKIESLNDFGDGDLTNYLQELRLDKNQITSLEEIKKFSKLTKLSINGNLLDRPSDEFIKVIQFLPKIQELEAESVGIENLYLDKLENDQGKELKRLYLPNNNIINFAGIEQLRGLVELDLRENLIRDKIKFLPQLTNLEILLLSHNFIIENFDLEKKTCSEDSSKNPKEYFSLRVLDLTNTSITSKYLNYLFSSNCFKYLESLTLDQNQINEIGEIQKLTNLEYLKISSNQLSNIKGIEKLEKLKQLILFNNQLRSIPDTISNLKKLAVLNLKANYFCDGSLSKLSPLGKSIKKLYLSQNPKNKNFLTDDASTDQSCSNVKCPFGGLSICIFDKDNN